MFKLSRILKWGGAEVNCAIADFDSGQFKLGRSGPCVELELELELVYEEFGKFKLPGLIVLG